MDVIYRVTVRWRKSSTITRPAFSQSRQDLLPSLSARVLYCGPDRHEARKAYHASTPMDCEDERFYRTTVAERIPDAGHAFDQDPVDGDFKTMEEAWSC